jgi:probable rRNA maturation factor
LLALPFVLQERVIIFEKTVRGASAAALERFARRARNLARVKGEVAVLVTSRRRIQALNRRFRRKDKPTDVLSFPGPNGGDIAICADIARANAQRLGHSVNDELKILLLHGMLHLAGYDHESDQGQMEAAEARLRARLKLPLSLIQRASRPASVVDRAASRRRTKKR